MNSRDSGQEWLHNEWGIEASVLYDRAPSFFHRTSLEERHALFQRILPSLGLFVGDVLASVTISAMRTKRCSRSR